MASAPLAPAHEEVISQFDELEKDNSVADTVFRVGNEGNTQDFHIIAALFSVRSPYFKRLLFGRLQEAQPSMDIDVDHSQPTLSTENFVSQPKKFVRMDDLSSSSFQFLKSLFYGNKPSLNKTIAPNVTYAAKKFLLKTLHKSCNDFISNLLPSDIPAFLKVLNDLITHGLKDETKELLNGNEKLWSDFITSPNFKLLPFITIKEILRSNSLTLTEEVIWDNCLIWAKYQFEIHQSIVDTLDTEDRKEGQLDSFSPFFLFSFFRAQFCVCAQANQLASLLLSSPLSPPHPRELKEAKEEV